MGALSSAGILIGLRGDIGRDGYYSQDTGSIGYILSKKEIDRRHYYSVIDNAVD